MTPAEFDRLVNLHLDEALTPVESRRLEAHMQAHPEARQRLWRACRLNEACRKALFRLQAETAVEVPVPVRRAPARLRWATGVAAAAVAMAVPAWLVTTQVAQQVPQEVPAQPVILAAATPSAVTPGVPVVRGQRRAAATMAALNFDTPLVSADDLVRALTQRSDLAMDFAVPQFLPTVGVAELKAPVLPAGSLVPVRRFEAFGSAALREAFLTGSEQVRYPIATVRFGW